MRLPFPRFFIALPAALTALLAQPALATQGHGAPEGLYAHQFAHVFFAISMGILIYWLRRARLVDQPGWRHIQFSAVFFILWNIDAFIVHMLEEQLAVLAVTRVNPWHISLASPAPYTWLQYLYIVVKLDHLLCVPAMAFLFSGLRRLRSGGSRPGLHGSTRT
ncbi:MAG: hypothetical protein LJE65_15255 [Desulfobacteraceae bacterium]|nr:hypothetical protein [Desulfobacteraceae bacterium]